MWYKKEVLVTFCFEKKEFVAGNVHLSSGRDSNLSEQQQRMSAVI